MLEPAQQIAIEALSQRFRGPLRRFFEKRLGQHSADIEDMVQQVFVRLATGAKVESLKSVEAYLFQTAANLLIDRQRRRLAREADLHDPYDDMQHGGATQALNPERELLGHEALEQLISALYELPERTRSVWALYHLEDLPHAQISRRLGMAQSTIEKHMSRANAHLLKRWTRYK